MTHDEMMQLLDVERKARGEGRLEGLVEGRRKGLQEARERLLAVRSAQHRDSTAWSLLRSLEAELEALCP